MVQISPEAAAASRALLQGDAARLVVAIVSMAIGLAAILVQALRWKSPDRVRLSFGLLALLYGYRALLMTDSARLFLSESALQFQIALITFTIGIPAILFGWGLVGKKHNLVTKSLLAVNVLMAAAFLALYWNAGVVHALFLLNNVLVIAFTIAMIAYLYVAPAGSIPELRTIRAVLLVWGGFVVYNNIRSILRIPSSEDFEFVGFAIFLCSLAYLVARRSMHTEEALASIRSELEVARRIQASILPEEMPQLDGIRIAARYDPMTEVAGDFYDFLVVDQHRVGVLIADVSGHGVPAALVASMVKVAIAAQAEHAEDPAKVMAGLNSVLAGKLQGQFVTAAYLFLDLKNGTFSYSAAGHPPLLHYRAAQQSVEGVVENGLILGFIPLASYESKTFPVGKGDRFLLYTDGVVEAAKAGEEFGEDRVKSVLSRASNAQDICASVSNEIRAWTGAVAGDDITIVAIDVA
jgi:sigma-B regulation protein RsbU (phosphoserine phosphatase)